MLAYRNWRLEATRLLVAEVLEDEWRLAQYLEEWGGGFSSFAMSTRKGKNGDYVCYVVGGSCFVGGRRGRGK